MAEIKRLLLAALLLAAITVAAAPVQAKEYDFEKAWRYIAMMARQENDHLRVENAELTIQAADAEKVPALMAQTTQLQEELDEANVIVSQVNGYNDLQQEISILGKQVGNAQEHLSSLYSQISDARTELNAVRGATASINAMAASFPTDINIGCRTFSGVSMQPTFYEDSLVCITQDAEELATVGIGDIVIGYCEQAGFFFIHRVYAEVDGKWLLKGDNPVTNPYPDIYCLMEKSTITWKVVGIAKDAYP